MPCDLHKAHSNTCETGPRWAWDLFVGYPENIIVIKIITVIVPPLTGETLGQNGYFRLLMLHNSKLLHCVCLDCLIHPLEFLCII